MKVVIVYVYPDLKASHYKPLARRFVNSYMENPPGAADHELIVAVTGGTPGNPEYRKVMDPLPCEFFIHNNCGKDIGAFQTLAPTIDCDLMICLGAPVHFYRAGWLDQIVNAYYQEGPALYGPWAFHEPKDHVRTTAFWLPPDLLKSYPYPIENGNRYEFEHGDRSIHAHVKSQGLESYMVTWGGCYPRSQWHHTTRQTTLFFDQHTEKEK